MGNLEFCYQNSHPKSKKFVKDKFFFDMIDQTGPFGNSAGSNALNEFINWRSKNKATNVLAFALEEIRKHQISQPTDEILLKILDPKNKEYSLFTKGEKVISWHGDEKVISIALAQFILEGEIDMDLLEIGLASLIRQKSKSCLEEWGKEVRDERIWKLEKIQRIFKMVKEKNALN